MSREQAPTERWRVIERNGGRFYCVGSQKSFETRMRWVADELAAYLNNLEARLTCKAPPIQYDPDCDHDSDPIEHALYIVVNNILKHVTTGKPWDCQDSCWSEDLTKARELLHQQRERAEAAELAETAAHYSAADAWRQVAHERQQREQAERRLQGLQVSYRTLDAAAVQALTRAEAAEVEVTRLRQWLENERLRHERAAFEIENALTQQPEGDRANGNE